MRISDWSSDVCSSDLHAWGWRLPFIFSILLLSVALWIRLQLEESSVFQRMKQAGATSKAPLKEAFGEWRNLKIVLIALFGAVAGQAVIGFAAHLSPLFYLEQIRSEEHTSDLQSLMRISYAVFCLKQQNKITIQ